MQLSKPRDPRQIRQLDVGGGGVEIQEVWRRCCLREQWVFKSTLSDPETVKIFIRISAPFQFVLVFCSVFYLISAFPFQERRFRREEIRSPCIMLVRRLVFSFDSSRLILQFSLIQSEQSLVVACVKGAIWNVQLIISGTIALTVARRKWC